MSTNMTTTVAINTSTSKQNYSFNKAGRFGVAKTPTSTLFYNKPGLFKKNDNTTNEGRMF